MPENANQHYVPIHYFRLFNGGKRQICVLLTKDGRFVPSAPIKGQCARHMFYGSAEIDRMFSKLEGEHASALRALVEMATTSDLTRFSVKDWVHVLQAIVFQRARTMLEVEKEVPAWISMQLHLFKEYVRHTRPAEEADEMIGAIDRGEIRMVENPTASVLKQIDVALSSAMLLLDMRPCVIRNCTDYPFIFSDSPAVFYNSFCRKITDRGVTGAQTPGLQVFLPLTSTLQLMLFDPAVYTGACHDGPFCEVTKRADVSQLNALQLHHSRLAIYFAYEENAEYVKEFYEAHKRRLVKPETVFRVRKDLLVKGEPCHDEILHVFDRQLNHDLSLSFITCTPVTPRNYVFRHRTPELVEENKRLNGSELH